MTRLPHTRTILYLDGVTIFKFFTDDVKMLLEITENGTPDERAEELELEAPTPTLLESPAITKSSARFECFEAANRVATKLPNEIWIEVLDYLIGYFGNEETAAGADVLPVLPEGWPYLPKSAVPGLCQISAFKLVCHDLYDAAGSSNPLDLLCKRLDLVIPDNLLEVAEESQWQLLFSNDDASKLRSKTLKSMLDVREITYELHGKKAAWIQQLHDYFRFDSTLLLPSDVPPALMYNLSKFKEPVYDDLETLITEFFGKKGALKVYKHSNGFRYSSRLLMGEYDLCCVHELRTFLMHSCAGWLRWDVSPTADSSSPRHREDSEEHNEE